MEQTCCGLPAKNIAEKEVAKEVALQNLAALDPADYDYILILCASCGSRIKEAYPKLLAGTPAAVKVEQLVDKLIDFSSFLTGVLKVKAERFRGGKKKVAYHSPCHLCRGMGVVQEPRDLLAIAGLENLPARDEDTCCGMGGTFSMDFPELSAELLNKKLDAVEETRADLLVTDCPGCVLQLKGGMDKRGMPVSLAAMATLNGMLFGLFPVVWIIITAIWVYNMSVESGEFEIIKNSLACITDDRRLQALFIAFAFGSFIEGTAGFGTPVAITAARLVGLGFQPVYAAGFQLPV
jgi:hypothetical protein